MLPLVVTHHFNHLRIAAEGSALVLELREDDKLIQSLKEPVCRLLLTAIELGALAAALQAGTPAKFGKRSWWKGHTLEVTGRPPAGLSWRKISVSRWLLPFYGNWRSLTISGKLVTAIAEAAVYVQSNPGPWSSSPGSGGIEDEA